MSRERTLRRCLTLLLLWCVVPLLLLNAYFALDNIFAIKVRSNEDAENLVNNLQASMDQDLQAKINGLQIIAASMRQDHSPDLHALYRSAEGFYRGFGAHVYITDAQFTPLLNTRVPLGAHLPNSTRSTVSVATINTLNAGKPRISDRFFGPIAQKPLVVIAVPCMRNNHLAFVVHATIELDQLQSHLQQLRLAAGWRVSITDGKGELLARFPALPSQSDRVGSELLRFSARSSLSRWTVHLDRVRSVQYQQMNRMATGLGLAILLATLASIVGGLLASRRLSREITKLVKSPQQAETDFCIKEIAAVSQQLDAARAAQWQSEQRFLATFEQAAIGIALLDPDGRWLRVNQRLCQIVGYQEQALLGKSFQCITHPDDIESELIRHRQMLAGEIASYSCDTCYVRSNGELVWVNLCTSLIHLPDQTPECFVFVVEDIAERKRTEQQLQEINASLERRVAERTNKLAENEAFVQGVLDSISSQIAVIDHLGNIVAVNETWRRFSTDNSPEPGKPSAHTDIGTNYLDICQNAQLEESQTAFNGIRAVLKGHLPVFSLEYPCHSAHEKRWFYMTVTPLRGGRIGAVVVHVDISERKQAEEKIEQLAFLDPLTNLPNRRLFQDRLKQAMALCKRTGKFGGLLFLDLDNFKRVNDSYGHDAGDLLLLETARRTLACVREVDTVARLGGDEFVVMLSQLMDDRSRSETLAREIGEKILNGLSAPYLLTIEQDGKIESRVEHQCTVSIGIALFGPREMDQNAILKRADVAMYLAKTAGRNTICFAPEAMVLTESEKKQPGNLAQLNWSSAYQSGHPQLDAQHQGLFATVNELLSALLANDSGGQVAKLIDQLMQDILQHFHDEEVLLTASAYPDSAAHIQLHQQLARRAVEMIDQFHADELDRGVLFAFFANEIVLQHILVADRAFFAYLQGSSSLLD